MSPALSVSAVTKTYKSGQVALHEIDLTVEKGEIFALLGPNGAGKTTLISIICGLVSMTSGRILVDGHDIVDQYRTTRAMIGLVPQEIALDIFATVEDTMRFSRGLFGKRAAPDHIDRLLRDLSLWEKRSAPIIELSGGMKRRVMIAKALSHEPDILFLDEPTAGVDVSLRRDMWETRASFAGSRRHHHPHHALHRGGRGDGGPRWRDRPRPSRAGRGDRRADAAGTANGA